MGEISDLKTIRDYNDLLGFETRNPLVSLVDFSKIDMLPHRLNRFGFYAIFLKEQLCGPLYYGRSKYDYQEGTLIFVAPGQVVGVDDDGVTYSPKGYALLFHPDFIRGTSLVHKMKEYSFFSYEANEALHMSDKEKQIIVNCLNAIENELTDSCDRHSRNIIVSNIEVLLNCSLRFYDRQFATREVVNSNVLTKLETLLSDYFDSDKPEELGLPSVSWCAEQLHFSPNYFGDLVKKQTGDSAINLIHHAVINKVKDKLMDPGKTVGEIAYEVGFQYPHHLSRLFKKVEGKSPNEYRMQMGTA